MRSSVVTFLVVLSVWCSQAAAQQWAEAMFSELQHDFGIVPRGADVCCEIVITNKYAEPVRIAELSRTCGCTLITLDNQVVLDDKLVQNTLNKTLNPLQQARLGVTMDTLKFQDNKSATITVQIDRPYPATVRLTTRCFIRQDMELQPGAVQFGAVSRGEQVAKAIEIKYTGAVHDWRIHGVVINNPHLEVSYNEIYRRNGAVAYRLNVGVKPTAPPGPLRDLLFVQTNDPQSPRVPVLIDGQLLPALIMTPTSLDLGCVKPDQLTRRFVLLRGKQPFRVVKVEGADDQFQAEFSDRAQTFHRVTVTFAGCSQPGTYQRTLRFETDLNGESATELKVAVRVEQ